MENSPDWEQQTLINELLQGREGAKQLQRHLNSTNCSHETRELLVQKILSSYNKALSMLKWDGSVGGEPVPQPHGAVAAIGWSESPRSSGSPLSEDSDRDFKKDHGPKDVSRKRKSMLRWTEQVQVCQGTGLEGPLDDGYSWRKYGQKDILGAKFPRGYYRCTHRHGQGCVATKQVQRSDEDPTIFEITYRGSHTCTQPQGSHLTPAPSAASLQIQEPNIAEQAEQLISPPQLQNQQTRSQEVLLNFQTGLRVITDDLDMTTRKQGIPPFYFPSTSHSKPENYIHSSPSVIEHKNFMGNSLSPLLASSATSGSNCFLVATTQMASFGGNQALSGPEPELPEKMFSATATSATNSATVGFDFPFDHFEPTFSIDNPGIFFP